MAKGSKIDIVDFRRTDADLTDVQVQVKKEEECKESRTTRLLRPRSLLIEILLGGDANSRSCV
jgi:hypothetical protein